MSRLSSPLFLLFCLVSLSFSAPWAVSALSTPTLPFGGLVTTTIACTCPGSIGNLWIFMTPFWAGATKLPAAGSVVYIPWASKVYAWYEVGVPGVWHLGSYIPGVQACWMLIPPPGTGCFPLPAAGVIFQVGTSKSI